MEHFEMVAFLQREAASAASDHDGTPGSAASAAEYAACFDRIREALTHYRNVAYSPPSKHPARCDCLQCVPF